MLLWARGQNGHKRCNDWIACCIQCEKFKLKCIPLKCEKAFGVSQINSRRFRYCLVIHIFHALIRRCRSSNRISHLGFNLISAHTHATSVALVGHDISVFVNSLPRNLIRNSRWNVFRVRRCVRPTRTHTKRACHKVTAKVRCDGRTFLNNSIKFFIYFMCARFSCTGRCLHDTNRDVYKLPGAPTRRKYFSFCVRTSFSRANASILAHSFVRWSKNSYKKMVLKLHFAGQTGALDRGIAGGLSPSTIILVINLSLKKRKNIVRWPKFGLIKKKKNKTRTTSIFSSSTRIRKKKKKTAMSRQSNNIGHQKENDSIKPSIYSKSPLNLIIPLRLWRRNFRRPWFIGNIATIYAK